MTGEPVEILLVDDNEDDLVIIQEAFAEAKLVNVINTVQDGEQALAYLRREGPYKIARRPGLIMLDINMPRKNGFEVLEAVKADATLRSLPVIMLTTSGRDEDIVRSYGAGACSYIRKPVDLHQFTEVVKHFELYWTVVSRIPVDKGVIPCACYSSRIMRTTPISFGRCCWRKRTREST